MKHNVKSRLWYTKRFLDIPKGASILDLGGDSVIASALREWGKFEIDNTGEVDLDEHYDMLKEKQYEYCTAFEVLEHLRNPYMVLKSIPCKYLYLSVPNRVWFAKPYWGEGWDTHYHEFIPREIRSLLEKTGWKIEKEELWKWKYSPLKPRPLLRKYGPWYSWIAIKAEKVG